MNTIAQNMTPQHMKTIPSMQQLTREDGTKMHAYVIPDFLQVLGYCPETVWGTLNSVPTISDDTETFWGETPAWTAGTHPALNYRGNAIKRTKQWFGDLSAGIPVYKYTGWQHAITRMTRPYTPLLEEIRTKIQATLPTFLSQANAPDFHCDFNHAIVTKYNDGDDNIGAHSDKEHTFEMDSYFLVIKFGDTRDFGFHEYELVFNKKTGKKKRWYDTHV